jgi:hypothetical protein
MDRYRRRIVAMRATIRKLRRGMGGVLRVYDRGITDRERSAIMRGHALTLRFRWYGWERGRGRYGDEPCGVRMRLTCYEIPPDRVFAVVERALVEELQLIRTEGGPNGHIESRNLL